MDNKLTRQLGIEFERRCQTFDPTMQTIGKLDTEDIYSFLNQYQLLFVKQMYLTQDKLTNGTHAATKVYDYLKTLNKESKLELIKNNTYKLPDDYFMYIRSYSIVNKADNTITVPNEVLDQYNVSKLRNLLYDNHRIIRKPIIVLDNNQVEIIKDEYTPILDVYMIYLRQPSEFSPLTNTVCELPIDCFEDLVTGAVELFFNYRYKVTLANSSARAAAKERARQQADTKDKENDND